MSARFIPRKWLWARSGDWWNSSELPSATIDYDGPQFTARARRLQIEAEALSRSYDDTFAQLNRWMLEAKKHRMTWVEGLCFAIHQMKNAAGLSPGHQRRDLA